MDTTLKMTKQGIRDLNSYGPRPKPVAAEGAALAETGAVPAGEAPSVTAVTGAAVVAGEAVVAPTDAVSS